jgi:hypothetical protein
MADTHEPRHEDLAPVYSRVSWGALFAGLFVTLTVFFLLSHLGGAIGLSVADDARGESIATGAGVWAVVSALAAFFCGGCVCSRLTAGESRTEAAVYGTILWGLTFAALIWLTGSVVRTGFTTVVGSANVAANATNPPANWEQAARRAGMTEAQVQQMRAELPTAEQARRVSAEAAWWSLLGVALSLGAAIGGAVAGAGSRPVVGGVLFRRTTVAVGHG